MIEKFEIITDRLLIRPNIIEDVKQQNEAIIESFEILNRWMAWAKNKPSIEDTEKEVNYSIKCWSENFPKELRLFIFNKENGKLIGATGLNHIDWDIPSFEIGYWIRTSEQRKGYAIEAVDALVDYTFNKLNANRVQICCAFDNEFSRKIPEKLDFELEARLKNHRINPKTGELEDTLIYAKISNYHLVKNRK